MKLFFRKKNKSVINETQTFFFIVIRTFFDWLEEFSIESEDLKADKFKKNIKKILEKILSEASPQKKLSFFNKYKKNILLFIKQQKEYFYNRENEFKDIIELLTQAVTTLNSENQNFNQDLLQKSEDIEKITLLNDIITIKNSLKEEVGYIKSTVNQKDKHDKKQIETLSAQVDYFKTELEKTKKDALIDDLTGVYNRKAFDNHLSDLIEQDIVIASGFSMILLDIDDFKQVNDLYGHQTGDRVLVAIAQQCKSLTRVDDFTARYGGEEFVIVFKKTSLKDVVKRADKICKKISDTHYSIKRDLKDEPLNITVSIGASVFKNGDTSETVIERADKALYLAKSLGKNQVVSEKYLK